MNRLWLLFSFYFTYKISQKPKHVLKSELWLQLLMKTVGHHLCILYWHQRHLHDVRLLLKNLLLTLAFIFSHLRLRPFLWCLSVVIYVNRFLLIYKSLSNVKPFFYFLLYIQENSGLFSHPFRRQLLQLYTVFSSHMSVCFTLLKSTCSFSSIQSCNSWSFIGTFKQVQWVSVTFSSATLTVSEQNSS